MEKKHFPGRREFLKLTLGAAAALLINACQPQRTILPTPSPSPAVTPTPTPMPVPPPVTIAGTETWQINAKAVDQEYQIFIALPASYNNSSKTYPVLYLLDANGSFAMATGSARMLQSSQVIPEFILAGIGYPDELSDRISNLRGRDFTPTQVTPPTDPYLAGSIPTMSGGAANFLKFIREELKPAIDARYRTNPADAVLHGHSLGGLFGLYALFHHDGAFKRYMVSKPLHLVG